MAVFEEGGNNYGMPAPEDLERLLGAANGGTAGVDYPDEDGLIGGFEGPYSPFNPAGKDFAKPGSEEFQNIENPEDRRRHLDNLSNQMLQENFELFKSRYLPVADSLASWFGAEGNQRVEDTVTSARNQGLAAGTTAKQSAKRDIRRYGVDLSAGQRNQMNNGLAMARTASGVSAGNTVRGTLKDSFMAAQQDFISLGHGAAGTGLAGQLQYQSSLASGAQQEQMMQMQSDQQAGANKSAIIGGLVGGAAKFAM